jgi:hypothetical protein
MNTRFAVIGAVLSSTIVAANSLGAQVADTKPAADTSSRWSLTVPGGTIVPTGAQRHAIKRGDVTAVQLAYAVRPALAITSTFGWARSRDIATAGDPKLDVFTYDVGVEARAPRWLAGNGMSLTPFAGAGAGGRSYNYRKLDVDATYNLAGYLSAGGELRIRRVGLRLEARDYLTQFKPLQGAGETRSGNDVIVMAGVHLFSR